MTHKQQTSRCNLSNQVFIEIPSGDIIPAGISEQDAVSVLKSIGYNILTKLSTGRNVYLEVGRDEHAKT